MMKAVCLICLIIFAIYHYVQGIIIYVNENSTNVLRCPFKADIGVGIDWNGPPSLMTYTLGLEVNPNLPHRDRISVVGKIDEGEYNLQISNIQQSDEGQYQCIGNLDGNIETNRLVLYVAVPPVTGPSLSRNPPGLVFVGNIILLKCEVSGGTPLANISWQCDGFFGELNTSTDDKIESTVNLTLNASDNPKKCTCIASHPGWTFPKSVDILLNVFSVVGYNVYVDEGSTETLVCPFKADPANSMRWSGPPNLITLSIGFDINPNLLDAHRFRLSVSGNGTNGEYNLKIANIQLHDEGVYRCNGVSGGSSASKDFNLFIKEVTLSTYPNTAVEGKDYSFICSYVNSFIEFRTDDRTICVIIGINADGTCKISGSYNTNFMYTCDSSTYNVTIPGLFLTENLHGTKWECLNVLDNSKSSGKKQLYVNIPITSVTLSNQAADENPVKVINGQNISFTCRTNAGRPSSKIQWYLASVNITSSASSQPDVCATDCSDDKLISSSKQIYKGKKDDIGKIIYCTAFNIQGHGVRSSNTTVDVLFFPNIHMEPIYNPYIVYHNQRDAVLICVIADANPSKAVTYEWNSPSGTVNTQNLTIPTVTKLHDGLYSCTASNIAGTSNKATKQLNVHYGPIISNISNQHDITEGNNFIVSPTVDANPVSKLVWWTKQNDANFRYDGSVLRINNINKNASGNYTCYVMNTLTPSGMSEINKTTHQTFSVNVVFKPFLDSTKPYSAGHVTAAINSTIRLTLTINANPVPTIEWTLRADKDWNSCNFITIVSNTTSINYFTSSSILIKNVNSNNFGDYVFTAKNTAGVFSRRFVVMDEELLRQEMFASNDFKENTGMFLAGIITLVVGLLGLMAIVIFVVRNRLKNKIIESSKTDQYIDVQRSNPAFTDAYTTLQSDIETREHQEQITNTYEECGRISEAHANSSVDNMESEPSQSQQYGVNTYEECGKRIEAHAYDTLNK